MRGNEIDNPCHAEHYQVRRRFCRACALQILYQLDLGAESAIDDNDFELFWAQLRQSGEELPAGSKSVARLKREVRHLIDLVLANRASLDEAIGGAASNWRLERMNVVDRNILRLGLAEIRYRANVPIGAAINEAIELAKEYGDKESPAFVNGILDRLAKKER